MKITPLKNFIHIKKEKPAEKTQGGIYLNKEEVSVKFQGKVVAIGPDVQQVKVGDTIIYKQFCSHAIPETTDEYIVAETDLLAVKGL